MEWMERISFKYSNIRRCRTHAKLMNRWEETPALLRVHSWICSLKVQPHWPVRTMRIASTPALHCEYSAYSGVGMTCIAESVAYPRKRCDTTSVLVSGIFSRGGWSFVRCKPGIHRKACSLAQVLRGFSTSWMSTATKLFAWRLSISACQYGGRYTRGEVKHCCSDHR